MMEDWTDIIGEELENIEEPLPADDWSVLQQKYAAARKRKKAAAFAWAGGITSVAAAIALVLMLVRPDSSTVMPDSSPVIPGLTGDQNDFVAETLPPIDTVLNLAPSVQKKVSAPVDVVRKTAEDVLVAENHTEEIASENTEEIFDVIRDTTSLKDKLLADASIANKKDSSNDAYTEPTGTFGFDDFPDDTPRRKRRPMSIGISGSTSDSPMMKPMADFEPPMDQEPSPEPEDSVAAETPQSAMTMMRAKSGYSDSYQHEIPVSVGLSARFFLTDRLSINTGLNYTRYKSLRTRWFASTHDQQKDWQYAHYLGIPVRLDWMIVNKKHFNFYIGAGVQADKCIYATYALLVMMFAQVSGFVPGELIHVIADAHIYNRHVPVIRELIERPQYPAPMVTLNPKVNDFYEFTTDDLIVENYQAGPQVKNIPIAV